MNKRFEIGLEIPDQILRARIPDGLSVGIAPQATLVRQDQEKTKRKV